MKKLILAVLAIAGIAIIATTPKAVSAYTETAYIVRDSATVIGVQCSTSTPTLITSILGNRSGLRVENQDATNPVFMGFNTSVSISTGALLGEKITAGSNVTYPIDSNINLYCIASGSPVWISVVQFGY